MSADPPATESGAAGPPERAREAVELREHLVLAADEVCLPVAPGEPCRALSDLLTAQGGDSLALLPLVPPARAAKLRAKVARARGGDARENAFERATNKARARLDRRAAKARPPIVWAAGELQRVDAKGRVVESIPAAYTFGLRRYRARLEAQELGLGAFYWGAEEALEVHQVAPFDDDESFEWGLLRERASAGLRDMARAATERLESGSLLGGDAGRRLLQVLVPGLALVLLQLGLAAGGSDLRVPPVLAVLPLALALGLRFLRRPAEPADERREQTQAEAAESWRARSPQLVALWAGAGLVITLLALLRTPPTSLAALDDVLDATTTALLLAVLVLTPLQLSEDRATLLGLWVETFVTLWVTGFVVGLMRFVPALVFGIVFGIVTGLLPFELPDWIPDLSVALADTATQVGFSALCLGYAWDRSRVLFATWALVPRTRPAQAATTRSQPGEPGSD